MVIIAGAALYGLKSAGVSAELYKVTKGEINAQDACKAALTALNAANLQLADIRQGAPEYLKNGYMAQLEQAEINRDMIANSIKKQEVRSPADSSVFDYEDKSSIFVVENGKACLRAVKKGIESDDFIEIQEGLKEGELILVKPDNSIKEGQSIKSN